jgi:hypothetical protein
VSTEADVAAVCLGIRGGGVGYVVRTGPGNGCDDRTRAVGRSIVPLLRQQSHLAPRVRGKRLPVQSGIVVGTELTEAQLSTGTVCSVAGTGNKKVTA